jgi:uncharacterized protein
MFKKLFAASLLSLCFVITVSAQNNKTTGDDDNSLLWEISGNGLATPSYLLGTYHLAGKSFVDSLEYIEPKFRACKTVVGEAIIDSTTSSKIMPMLMLNNTSLNKLYTRDEYQALSDTFSKVLHVNINLYKTFKPAALEVFVAIMIAPQTITATNPPMDLYFQNEGKKLNDKVIGLETAEFQMDVLLNGDLQEQKKHLMFTIKNINKARADIQKLYAFYNQQNLQKLDELMNEDDGYTQEENDKLVKDRNLKWMKELPAIMSENSSFIVVGSGHLVGEYGLINQLRLKGYTVTAVRQ